MTRLDTLRAIMAHDPGGWDHEPNDADYAAHEAWAVATYGAEAWRAYAAGGWEPMPDK